MSTIAKTIAAQLGGNRFVAMTGATLIADHHALIIKLPRSSPKGRINAITIALEPSDTYRMTFFHQQRAPSVERRVVAEQSDVYAEDLQRLFTDMTGLHTTL